MKTIFFLIAASIFSLVILGCKKDEAKCTPSITSIIKNDASTIKVAYDNQNRISEYTSENNIKFKFQYNGLTGKLQIFNADTLFRTDNLTFDANGRLTSYEEFVNFSGDILRYFYLFYYNNEGYLSSTVQTLTGDGYDSYYKDTLIYTNGNLTKKITKLNNGTTTYRTIDFTYGSLSNKTWNFYWNAYTEPFEIVSGFIFLYSMLGKPSQNLPTNIVVTEGTFIDNFSYDYSLNSDGSVLEYNEARTNSIIGSISNNFKLNYNCK
ncbi:MAG: DUF4595 domain-containing protein [Chitinophagales bacterium]|nr:DUF4595 domain-containing protein [Chitinophagales bacterium]